MSTLSKRWVLKPAAPLEQLKQYRGMSPTLAQILINRGFDTSQAAAQFLYDKKFTNHPLDMPDMSKAVGRIRQAIREREPIVVYGDFDADGVTSTTLLVLALRALGANVRPYIPHRVDEGYGLNSPALRKLAKEGAKLVITGDCGIRSVEEVKEGNAAGLNIIITDHHSLGPEPPPAFAIVNCKREGYPEPLLAGVGVTFKLVQALIMAKRKQLLRRRPRSDDPYAGVPLDKLYDLVAIGTVADMVPLNSLENRVLVRRGLEVLNKAERPGVRALLEVAGIEPGSVTATSIGFGLGPRINAAGRLANAMLAYDLLMASNMTEAQKLAQRLQELNIERQDKTRAAQDMFRQQLEAELDNGTPLIFADSDQVSPGIVGLVAGRLVEEFYRPTVIMERGETESHASCRSIPEFNITEALDQCADLLVRHGGHDVAAGLTIYNKNIETLRERLTQLATSALEGRELRPMLGIDMEVNIHALDEALVRELELLEPCGTANPQPVFMTRNVHVAECRTVGQGGNHLKLQVSRAGSPPLDAIGFGLGDWARRMPHRIDVAFQLEMNEWQGRSSLQMNLKDIREATPEDS